MESLEDKEQGKAPHVLLPDFPEWKADQDWDLVVPGAEPKDPLEGELSAF